MEASGAGGFEPWEEPKTRALAAACFHQVPKVNRSAWNFSMLPRDRANTMDMEKCLLSFMLMLGLFWAHFGLILDAGSQPWGALEAEGRPL